MTDYNLTLPNILDKLVGGTILDVASGSGDFTTIMESSFTNPHIIISADKSIKSLKILKKNTNSNKIIPVILNGNLLGV